MQELETSNKNTEFSKDVEQDLYGVQWIEYVQTNHVTTEQWEIYFTTHNPNEANSVKENR